MTCKHHYVKQKEKCNLCQLHYRSHRDCTLPRYSTFITPRLKSSIVTAYGGHSSKSTTAVLSPTTMSSRNSKPCFPRPTVISSISTGLHLFASTFLGVPGAFYRP